MNHDLPRGGPLVYTSLAAVALLCVAPFLQPFHHFPLTAFYSEWLAFALGLAVMAVLLERRTWLAPEVPWIAVMPFALAALLIVHGALDWSPYFGQALTGALYLIWAGALIIAGRALVVACGRRTTYTLIAASVAAGAVLSALIGIIQHFNLITPFNSYIARPTGAAIFGNLAQANHYANHAAIGLFSIAYLYASRRVVLAIAAAGAIPLIFVLGLSGSRSAWLYLFAAFALAARLRSASPQDAAGRRLFIMSGCLIIACYAMQLLVDAGWFRPADRDVVTTMERLFSGAESTAQRISLARAAWSMALEHPLLGVGWGGFASSYFYDIADTAPAGTFSLFQNAHNILLHFLAETGVTGTLILMLPLLVWVYQARAGTRNADQWWLLAASAVLVLHSLLEYPLWYAYFLGVAALLLGIAPTRAFVPRLAPAGRSLSLAVVFVGAFNLATLWFDYREFETVFSTPPEQLRNSDFSATMSRLHRNPVLTAYIELASALPLTVDQADLQQRLFLNERALRFAPLPTLVYRQVLLLVLADRAPEAQALLIRARRAYPADFPEFEQQLARLAREYPGRFRPLLESPAHVPRSKGGK